MQRIRKALEELQGSTLREVPRCKQDDTGKREDAKNTDHDTSAETSRTQSRQPIDISCVKTEPVSLAGDDLVFLNGQSADGSEGLASLIGTLRQQIHASDWLEKNKPELAAGEDPARLDVFIDLLNRARK